MIMKWNFKHVKILKGKSALILQRCQISSGNIILSSIYFYISKKVKFISYYTKKYDSLIKITAIYLNYCLKISIKYITLVPFLSKQIIHSISKDKT